LNLWFFFHSLKCIFIGQVKPYIHLQCRTCFVRCIDAWWNHWGKLFDTCISGHNYVFLIRKVNIFSFIIFVLLGTKPRTLCMLYHWATSPALCIVLWPLENGTVHAYNVCPSWRVSASLDAKGPSIPGWEVGLCPGGTETQGRAVRSRETESAQSRCRETPSGAQWVIPRTGSAQGDGLGRRGAGGDS
jgi:hypothetical protein